MGHVDIYFVTALRAVAAAHARHQFRRLAWRPKLEDLAHFFALWLLAFPLVYAR